jgi:hypothetical protein
MTATERSGANLARIALTALAIGLAGVVGFFVGRRTHVGERHAAVEAEVDALFQRAEKALEAEQYDWPRGDNVLEITDDALSHAPGDHRIKELRQRASDKLIRRALIKRAQGQRHEALRDLELAARLSRPDHGLLDLIEETRAGGAGSASPSASSS